MRTWQNLMGKKAPAIQEATMLAFLAEKPILAPKLVFWGGGGGEGK